MGRIEKLKREAIQEANKRNLGIIDENHAGFSLGFANNGGLTFTEESENDVVEEDYDVEYQDDNWLVLHDDDEDEKEKKRKVKETTLSQEFNDDNEGDEDEVDTDQIEEQDDVPLDEIT